MTKGWVQAAAVFWQVADALARAEEWTHFEVSSMACAANSSIVTCTKDKSSSVTLTAIRHLRLATTSILDRPGFKQL